MAAAPSPCTRQPATRTRAPGKRPCTTRRKSCSAAPEVLVATPMRAGRKGSGRFRAWSRSPSAASLSRSCWSASARAPAPRGSTSWTTSWYRPRGRVDLDAPPGHHLGSVAQVEFHLPCGGGPEDRVHRGVGVLQAEVDVAARLAPEVSHLAGHPDVLEGRLDRALEPAGQLGDGEHARLPGGGGRSKSPGMGGGAGRRTGVSYRGAPTGSPPQAAQLCGRRASRRAGPRPDGGGPPGRAGRRPPSLAPGTGPATGRGASSRACPSCGSCPDQRDEVEPGAGLEPGEDARPARRPGRWRATPRAPPRRRRGPGCRRSARPGRTGSWRWPRAGRRRGGAPSRRPGCGRGRRR